MPGFERVIVADWSASGQRSPARPSADAIWLGSATASGVETRYFRTRAEAEAALTRAIADTPGRILIGFDFPMGYPAGFAGRLTGASLAPAVWHWLAERLTDGPDNRNNRFAVADRINAAFGGAAPDLGPTWGPFWGRPRSLPLQHLPEKKMADYKALGLEERRLVETVVPRAQPVWKLYTTGAAGSQGLVGQPMIHRLAALPGVAVWPFAAPDTRVVLAEVYPSVLARAVAADAGPIKDEAQVRLLARALWALSRAGRFAPLWDTPEPAREEGWILGAGQAPLLAEALTWR